MEEELQTSTKSYSFDKKKKTPNITHRGKVVYMHDKNKKPFVVGPSSVAAPPLGEIKRGYNPEI